MRSRRDEGDAGAVDGTGTPVRLPRRGCRCHDVDMNQRLRPEAIEELKAIWRREYGEEISDEKAWEVGNRLVRLFAILTRAPMRSREVRSASGLTEHRPAR